jgi:hypothetical protein
VDERRAGYLRRAIDVPQRDIISYNIEDIDESLA